MKLFPYLFCHIFIFVVSPRCSTDLPVTLTYHRGVYACESLFKLMFLEGEEHWKLFYAIFLLMPLYSLNAMSVQWDMRTLLSLLF